MNKENQNKDAKNKVDRLEKKHHGKQRARRKMHASKLDGVGPVDNRPSTN